MSVIDAVEALKFAAAPGVGFRIKGGVKLDHFSFGRKIDQFEG